MSSEFPDGSTPDGSTPDGSTPGGSTPDSRSLKSVGDRAADLRGAVQLAAEGTVETARLVEAIHAGVLSTLIPDCFRKNRHANDRRSPRRTRGLTGWIYRTVRRIARLSGRGATAALRGIERAKGPAQPPSSDARRRVRSILNGVLGDHLAATDNPLARSFSLRTPEGTRLDEATAGESLIVFVHGLCLDDRAWMPASGQEGHVRAWAEATGGRPVLARYNTGLSIASNGRRLSEHLDAAVGERTARIVLVGHSMGGLVLRHAFAASREASARWPALVTEAIYLGTPHGGSPLEQTGAWIERRLRRSRFTAPFATLAGIRSRGIQDLRHGAASETGAARPGHVPPAVPPSGRCLYVAAQVGPASIASDRLGDGLVPVSSALDGRIVSDAVQHRVFRNLGHLDLLHAPAVTQEVVRWLETEPSHFTVQTL